MRAAHPAGRVADHTAAGWWGGPTWSALLLSRASERPGALALVDPPNRSGLPSLRLTWAELSSYVGRLASALRAAGVGRDDVVGVQLPNGHELTALYLALDRLGAIASPFPVQYREHELTLLARAGDLRFFVTAGVIGTRRTAEEAVKLLSPLPVLAFGSDLPADAVPLLPDAYDELLADDGSPQDVVTICWTSGTEAAPKGVPRCADDWRPLALATVDAAGLTCDDVLLNPFPMVNMAGIGGMFVPWLLTGATLVQHQPFDPEVFFGQLAGERATYTVVPPTLLAAVLARPDLPAAVLSSLRILGSGSAPLSPAMTVGWKERFGLEVINCFGSNEGACLAGDPATVPDLVDRATLFPRFGSPSHTWPNRASYGMRTRLVSLDGEVVEEAGVPGELRITGPGVFAGYLAGTGPDPFDAAGFFRTGDLFEYVASPAGDLRYLRYVARSKDIVVRGGMNISPAEVEGLLASHPSVAEVCVVGVPDPLLGERACAVVVASGPVTLDDLVAHLRAAGVASYKLPELLRVVDALPRNPLGKVLRNELRELL